ncbi:MAG: hypothetical protein KDA85_00210, partial [Planctomycetaceae bacterium]|nr:hypothetical protein [Planctomycetaceae bacterium]
MTKPESKGNTPEQIVRKLRDANAILNAGEELALVLQAPKVNEATFRRGGTIYGRMKSVETMRLKSLEDENERLKLKPSMCGNHFLGG